MALAIAFALLWQMATPEISHALLPGAPAVPGSFIAELQRPASGDANLFGKSVAVAGHWAAVGSQTPDYQLAPSNVYAYDLSDPLNIVRRTFVNPAIQNGSSNKFGESVAIKDNWLFVGDPEPQSGAAGIVHVYDLNSPSSAPFKSIQAFDAAPYTAFGVSLAVDGNRLVVGSPDYWSTVTLPPAVYILDITNINSVSQFKIVPDPSNNVGRFGDDVDISGNFLIVGDSDDASVGNFVGAAHLYDLTNPAQIKSKKLLPNDPSVTRSFGRTVAISGAKALVGAVGDVGPIDPPGSTSGVAYLHDFSNWNNVRQYEFAGDNTVGGDAFGGNSGVDLVGNLAVVGAKGADGEGSVYFFDVTNPADIQQLKELKVPAPMTFDLFGNALATDGDSLVVASLRGNPGATPGRAYLFAVPEPAAMTICAALIALLLRRRGLAAR
jgi:hypothetical protein